MSDVAASTFVRDALVPERPAPIKTTGFVGFLRTRLFNSPTNILLTVLGALLIWFTVIPALRFLLVDAVWHGTDRNACLAENAGHPVGACWPYINAKFNQFIYGFYPEAELWRVNLTFLLGALLLLPLLIPRMPAKSLNAGLFFIAFPFVAFFLLHGGGLKGFGISWTASILALFADSISGAGDALVRASASTPVIGVLVWLLGKLFVVIGMAASLLISPMVWLMLRIAPTADVVTCCMLAICERISSVACAVWLARLLTSEATTAKPLPASSARAASMVALSASRLVCEAMT